MTPRVDDHHVLSGPFWGELRVFLAVAKAKSFNRAAEQLNMSQPTVSRQVRRLQDVMRTQLVVSTAAGVRLTRHGEELAKSLLDLDQKLFDITNDLSADARAAEGLVRVCMGEAMAGLFVAPNLSAFSEHYPNIRLDIRKPVNVFNFRENRADLLLGHAPSPTPDVTARPLGFIHFLPIATRAYIERYGVPTRSNLSSHCFVNCDAYEERGGLWGDWQAVTARGVVTHSSDNSFTYALMVKSGLGIGLMASYVLSDPAAIPLDLGVHVCVPMYALASTERLKNRAVQVVFDWITELFGASNPWFGSELRLDQLPRDALSEVAAQLLSAPKPDP